MKYYFQNKMNLKVKMPNLTHKIIPRYSNSELKSHFADANKCEFRTSSETLLNDGKEKENLSEEINKIELNAFSESKIRRNKFLVYTLSCLSAIGGFLFGYDTGVVSGAILLLRKEFKMTNLDQELFISSTMAAAAIFSLIGGILNNIIGRKPSILIATFLNIIGLFVLFFSTTFSNLITGRFIVGIGIGISSSTIPIYISECSPPDVRGQLVTIFQIFITGGQFSAYILCGVFSYNSKSGWRYMLGIAIIPGLFQLLGFCMMPESPRWLYVEGRIAKSREVFMSLMGSKEMADSEMRDVQISLSKQDKKSCSSLGMLKKANVRRALFIGVMLHFFQQFTGINTVMYYSATIIEMSGVQTESTAIWLSVIVALLNFLFTFLALYLVDRIGRRQLLLFSLSGSLASMIVLAIIFQLSSTFSPISLKLKNQSSNCFNYNNCDKCMSDSACGFCSPSDQIIFGVCLPISSNNIETDKTDSFLFTDNRSYNKNEIINGNNETDNIISGVNSNLINSQKYRNNFFEDRKRDGNIVENNITFKNIINYDYDDTNKNLHVCNMKIFTSAMTKSLVRDEKIGKFIGNITDETRYAFTQKHCSSQFSWLLISAMSLYIIFFAQGMGPLPWIINSEIFPLTFRSTGNSITTTVNWISNLIISLSFLSLSEAITKHGAFYLYACFLVIAIIFFYLFLPETQNIPLEEMNDLFHGSWIVNRRSQYFAEYGTLE